MGGKRVNTSRGCEVLGCERVHLAKGLCRLHYTRVRFHGDTQTVKSMKPSSFSLEERIESHLDRSSGFPDFNDSRVRVGPETGQCWTTDYGTVGKKKRYSQISVGGKLRYLHRVAYELWVGPIPAGLYIDHLCRNTRCVNPNHLEPVTSKENKNRSYLKEEK